MGQLAVDLTGQRFGFLTALTKVGRDPRGCALWECVCDCGSLVVRKSQYLRSPRGVRHCGCEHGNKKHGLARSRPYNIWVHMRGRCLSPEHPDYHRYGGRGITVCAAWAASFDAFWADMALGYADTLSLDRRDNDGPYAPNNCRWATPVQQAQNRRPRQRAELPALARATGIPLPTLYDRRRWGRPLVPSTT